ncbi:DUF2922 domain-containing protein [Chryseomicrobium sp. FSL W7-1435]|uniref:DUF2922 domain-containing protein n=1 Tax=Chryseomicrobium sp. FSL W7-1435 TaxID=2921704 RepID=UPI00315AC333
MAKTLQLEFANATGKKLTVAVEEPRENLTVEEVEAAMQQLIESEVFAVDTLAVTESVSAQIIDRNVQQLF